MVEPPEILDIEGCSLKAVRNRLAIRALQAAKAIRMLGVFPLISLLPLPVAYSIATWIGTLDARRESPHIKDLRAGLKRCFPYLEDRPQMLRQWLKNHRCMQAREMLDAYVIGRKAGILECTFEQETYEDLFGEQCVLCGGLVELMRNGFEVLVEAGYPPEMAYFECVHEMKLIVDLVWQGGIKRMAEVISNTAEYGMWAVGHQIIGPEVKEKMKEALKRVENGEFANEWVDEYKRGIPLLKASREKIGEHQVETVGAEIRKLFAQK